MKWNKSVSKTKQCQKKFEEHTNNTDMAKIFVSPKDLNILTKGF